MWNPSTCECECDKYCGNGQYLDYDNCICRIFCTLLIVGLIYYYCKKSNKKY